MVSAVKITAQVTLAVDLHPDHEEKVLMPTRAGAVRVKGEPEV